MVEIAATSSALGAEVRGVDLSEPIAAATISRIKAAWSAHLVLLFRNQTLDDAALVRFSRHFGALDAAPPVEAANKGTGCATGYPEVTIISNVIVNGVPIGALGAGEADWHTDMSYNREPPSASLLYALEVPPSGGDTSFLNMYRAYDSLPEDVRATIGSLRAIHDATYTSAGDLRKGIEPVTDVRRAPGADHPLVRVHPETGQPALFLGRRRNAYILGQSVRDSDVLLDLLWEHATRPEFVYAHRWRVGDLLIWDNRCVMHRRDSFAADARRIMHRTQVKGDVPRGIGAAATDGAHDQRHGRLANAT